MIGDLNQKIRKGYCIQKKKGNYADYYDGVYNAIRNNVSMPVSGEEGMNVIRIIEAAFRSNKEKEVIEL